MLIWQSDSSLALVWQAGAAIRDASLANGLVIGLR
jgi:hypothetical protein